MSCILVPSLKFCRPSRSTGFKWGVVSGAWGVWASAGLGVTGSDGCTGVTVIPGRDGPCGAWGGSDGTGTWPTARQAVKTNKKKNAELRNMGAPWAAVSFNYSPNQGNFQHN